MTSTPAMTSTTGEGEPYKALRLDADTFPVTTDEKQLLRDAGVTELVELNSGAPPEELVAAAQGAAVVIVVSSSLKADVISRLSSCRHICRLGDGTDKIDVEAATKNRIVVTNVPDFCVNEMAEHAMALVLAIARKLPIMHRSVEDRTWLECRRLNPLRRVRGQTMGLVGFGRAGQEIAVRARAFGLTLIDYHRNVDPRVEERFGVTPVSLETLLRRSDFVVVACPLTPTTRGMLGPAQLSHMKPNAAIINIARGGIIDEIALAALLKEGRVAAAGIDCHEAIDVHLPPKAESATPFLNMPNVILTPHIGGSSLEAQDENRRTGTDEIRRVRNGEWPRNVVNPEVKIAISGTRV